MRGVVIILAWIWAFTLFFIFALSGNDSGKDDRFSSSVLFASLSTVLPAMQFAAMQGEHGIGALDFGSPILGIIGIALLFCGGIIHAMGIITLRKQWSTAVVLQPDHALIDTGIYRHLRHPVYAGILLEIIGLTLGIANWIALLAVLVLNGAAVAYRIHVEEDALARYFGERYSNYIRRTKRLIPGVF